MALRSRSWGGPAPTWLIGMVVMALVVADVTGDTVEFGRNADSVHSRMRRSPKWSTSSKKSTPSHSSTSPSQFRATSAPAPARRPTTAAYHPPATTSAPPRKATTQGPIYPHPKPATTTPTPHYPKQVYHPAPPPPNPPPVYPVPLYPPPIYVPPPPPNNPTIIIIKEATPKPPKQPFFLELDFTGGSSHKAATHKPTTTTTTTTRRPKTTTEEPWHGIEGGYDRKSWIDMVKTTQRPDIPLSGQWVRLRGGKSMREGYVEILGEGGLWGSVCDAPARWDLHKAGIVCRQLGYRGGAEAAWQGRPADNGSQPLAAHVREVSCGPQPATLLHCNLRRSKDGHPAEVDADASCFGRRRDAGVRCRPEPNTGCRFGEKAFGKSCYRITRPHASGSAKEFATLGADAVKACRGGVARSELVSVTTQAENDFLSDWLQAEHPGVDMVLTSGIGTHSRLHGAKKPLVEWWMWSGQYRDIDYEKWWPGWTSTPTITPIVPPKTMMCIVLQNRFKERKFDPPRTADYFYWKAKSGTDKSKPIPFICERPADDVGCLTANQEYAGPANISESGKACLNWNLQQVRNSPITAVLFLVAPVALQELVASGSNACRRLTLDKEPWCFVSPGPGQQPVPEQCLIPACGQPSAITSYYEAPKKTNYYAPNFNQIPATIPPPTAPAPKTDQLPDITPIFFSGIGRALVVEEEPEAEGVVIVPKSPEDEKPVQPFLKGAAPEPPPPPPLTLGREVPTLQPPPFTISIPHPLSSDTVNRVISVPVVEKQEIDADETSSSTVTTTTAPSNTVSPEECRLGNDTTNQPCVTVTYPPVATAPSLSYPHPENEIVTTATSIGTTPVIPKRSLYGTTDSIKTRYAAGKGRPFDRTLSSSDLVLILNGILPLEEVNVTAESNEVPTESKDAVTETNSTAIETNNVLTRNTDTTGRSLAATGGRPTETAAEAVTDSPAGPIATVAAVTDIPAETAVVTGSTESQISSTEQPGTTEATTTIQP